MDRVDVEHGGDSDEHGQFSRKPDTPEWIRHMLTDDSWEEWRSLHADKVERLTRELAESH